MNILVTGGAGYIGSHAGRELLNSGHKVVVLDDLSHGHRAAVDPRAHLVVGGVADREVVRSTLREFKIDAVMHFAAFIEVGESVTDPEKYYRNNFVNALTMLQVLREENVRRLVFSSTAAVYGVPDQVPITEEHPLKPINPYGASKAMTETAIRDFSAAYGLGYTVLRYFNVAGAHPDGSIGEAHEPESHLIPRVLTAARDERATVTLFGTDYPTPDGTCVRDYVHVCDLAAAHVLALEKGKAGQGAIYNLGSEKGFSVREVIAACREVTGRPIEVLEKDRRPGDPAQLVASSAKIRRELGWQPRYPDLKTIIAHAWNWHTSHPLGFGT